MARDRYRLEVDAGYGDGLAAFDAGRPLVWPQRNVRKELARLLEDRPLELGDVDRSTRPFGEVGHSHQVIPVAVRDEDPGAASAHPGQLEAELRGPVTRVDHRRFGCAAVQADDVAVLLRGSEHESVDDQGHR